VAHILEVDRRHRTVLLRERDVIDLQPVDAVGADDLDLLDLKARAADRLRIFLVHLGRHTGRMRGDAGKAANAEPDRPVRDALCSRCGLIGNALMIALTRDCLDRLAFLRRARRAAAALPWRV
jgi:hypothetical protein